MPWSTHPAPEDQGGGVTYGILSTGRTKQAIKVQRLAAKNSKKIAERKIGPRTLRLQENGHGYRDYLSSNAVTYVVDISLPSNVP